MVDAKGKGEPYMIPNSTSYIGARGNPDQPTINGVSHKPGSRLPLVSVCVWPMVTFPDTKNHHLLISN